MVHVLAGGDAPAALKRWWLAARPFRFGAAAAGGAPVSALGGNGREEHETGDGDDPIGLN